MAADTCDGCGRPVRVAGGMGNLWTFGADAGGSALSVELRDGSEYLLCRPCVAVLPEDPSAADIAALERLDGETSRLEPD